MFDVVGVAVVGVAVMVIVIVLLISHCTAQTQSLAMITESSSLGMVGVSRNW